MLHSKTLVVDDHCAMVGTANFDNRSFRLNFEVMAVVYGHGAGRPLAAQFETDLRSAAAVRANRPQTLPGAAWPTPPPACFLPCFNLLPETLHASHTFLWHDYETFGINAAPRPALAVRRASAPTPNSTKSASR